MDIPYDLIHELEDQYGNLSLVPENNLILENIHKLFYENEEKLTEINVKKLVKSGYSISEIAIKLNYSQNKIKSTVNRLGLTVRPYFKYVAISRKTGQKIYSRYFSKYRIITHQTLNFIESAKFYLNKEGYYLKKFNSVVRFPELDPGDQYFYKNKLYTK